MNQRPKTNDQRPRGWAARKIMEGDKYDAIITAVTHGFGVSMSALVSPDKHKQLVTPRWALMYLLRKHARLTLVDVGQLMKCDHTTVIHACRKVEERIKADGAWRDVIEQLEEGLKPKNSSS